MIYTEKKPRNHRVIPSKEELQKKYDALKTIVSVMKYYKVSDRTIKKWFKCRRIKVDHRKAKQFGQKHRCKLLPPKEVIEKTYKKFLNSAINIYKKSKIASYRPLINKCTNKFFYSPFSGLRKVS